MKTTIKATFKIVLECDGRILSMDTFNSDNLPVGMDMAIDLPFDVSNEIGLVAAQEIGKQLQKHIDTKCIGVVKHGTDRMRAMVQYGLELPDIKD